MRSIGSALVWIGLMVGLPGMVYPMMAPNRDNALRVSTQNPQKCSICRCYHETKAMPVAINGEDMIVVSPSLLYGDGDAAGSDGPQS
jgi:hypothetical protein